jgi:DNA (cytosine-5)-methyltransferase 1
MLTHIDLFSGIGGFALAARWAGFRTIAFCENEPFCQEVLAARFGAVADSEGLHRDGGCDNGTVSQRPKEVSKPRNSCWEGNPVLVPDIRDFDGTRYRNATLLTGGFPCQPFSHAGKRRGKDDDRHLWPEMLRVIREAWPAWVIGENVAGFISMELDGMLADLEGEGYETQPIVIPACAAEAIHERARVWIIAHADGAGLSQFITPGTQQQGRLGSYRVHLRRKRSKGDTSQAFLRRGDDGIPKRVDRIKALGNAIVPAVAYEIIKCIAEIERS